MLTVKGYVYLFKTDRYYKLGISKNAKNRISQVRSATPFKVETILNIEVENYEQAEKNLHFMFSAKWIRGEWFKLTRADVAIIKDYLTNIDIRRKHDEELAERDRDIKRVSLRNFQLKPSKYIKDLPIEITRYGKSIARIDSLMGTPPKKVMKDIAKDLKKELKPPSTCKHGYPTHLCTICKSKASKSKKR